MSLLKTAAGVIGGAAVSAILVFALSESDEKEKERQRKDVEAKMKTENKAREERREKIIREMEARYEKTKSEYEVYRNKNKENDKVMMSLFAIGVSAISRNKKIDSDDMEFLKTIVYGLSSDLIKDETQDILNKISENPVEWIEASRIAKYELNNEEKKVLNNLLMLIASKYKNVYDCIFDLELVI